MKWPIHQVLTMVLCIGITISPRAWGQAVTDNNAQFTGPLAGLAEATAKVGFDDQMPAKLCGLLWPAPGTVQKKCSVRKVEVEGKSEDEKKILILRVDTHDVVFAHTVVSKPKTDSKMRREYYYRANAKGDLALALKVTFQFTITDVDNDVLQKVTWETYAEKPGDDGKTLAITPEVKSQFETEKKFWLKQQKSLKKQEHDAGP